MELQMFILFLDMLKRDLDELRRFVERKAILEAKKKDPEHLWTQTEQDELNFVDAQLERGEDLQVVDRFFLALRRELISEKSDNLDHVRGILPSQLPNQEAGFTPGQLIPEELMLAAVFGLMELDNVTNPALADRFIPAVSVARGEFRRHRALFEATLPHLMASGLVDLASIPGFPHQGRFEDLSKALNSRIRVFAVNAEQWAAVVRKLAAEGVEATDPLLSVKTERALGGVVGVDEGAPPSLIDIDLPDLEAAADVDIVVDNLHAVQAVYFSAMLEELKLYQVVDKLAELFQFGMLPIGRSEAGNFLYRYWKESANRVSETERRNLYARVFGMPGGDATGGQPNREFNDLWLRFVSAVSSYVRQLKVDSLLRANVPVSVSQELVRKAGRDLAANLSLHGYGIAYFVATELQDDIKSFIKLLSDSEIRNAYGARDMWQVVDQVATLELGGARNSVRYRTMAQAGAIIVRWLAKKAKELSSAYLVDVISLDELRRPMPRGPQAPRPTVDPIDFDLVNACEQWLAVTGTSDERVEEYSQPMEGPNMTSRPIQIPSVARDALEAAGIALPMGVYGAGRNGNGNGNGYGRR